MELSSNRRSFGSAEHHGEAGGALMCRRELLRLGFGLAAFFLRTGDVMGSSLIKRSIPRTGESLPAVGLGTWQTFDVGGADPARKQLAAVIAEFAGLGGSVVDSSPMYGNAETTVGDLAAETGVAKKLFFATKVWTRGREAGIRQMEESLRRLRVARLDLMQVHNLLDWRTHLMTLRQWKNQNRVRYIGVTHYTASAYDELENVLRSQELDFVQLNYSLAEREAERRLLPTASDRGIAVLVNRPFAEGALFRKVHGKSLPGWAKEIGCASWSQFFLKFIISHPAVTCAIPATRKLEHLTDNMAAGTDPLPDRAMRTRMARFVEET